MWRRDDDDDDKVQEADDTNSVERGGEIQAIVASATTESVVVDGFEIVESKCQVNDDGAQSNVLGHSISGEQESSIYIVIRLFSSN